MDGAVSLNSTLQNIFTKNQKSILRRVSVCVNRWSTNTSDKHTQTVWSVFELCTLIQRDAFRSDIWSTRSAGQNALPNNSPPPTHHNSNWFIENSCSCVSRCSSSQICLHGKVIFPDSVCCLERNTITRPEMMMMMMMREVPKVHTVWRNLCRCSNLLNNTTVTDRLKSAQTDMRNMFSGTVRELKLSLWTLQT